MDTIKIVYDFAFPDGGSKAYTVELDRATLDQITASYPHVRQVLEEFYLARAMNTAEGT